MANNTDPFWYKNYDILFSNERYSEFFPTSQMSITEKMNSITRLGIYIGILLTPHNKST